MQGVRRRKDSKKNLTLPKKGIRIISLTWQSTQGVKRVLFGRCYDVKTMLQQRRSNILYRLGALSLFILFAC